MTRYALTGCFLSLALSGFFRLAAASDFTESVMPQGMAMEISIRSTVEFLEAIDAGVAASTRGAETPIAAGAILNWSKANLPLFLDERNRELGVHLYLPVALSRYTMDQHALILSNSDFDEFLRFLREKGIASRPDEPTGYTVLTPANFFPYFAKAVGGKRIVLAPRPEVVKNMSALLEGGWQPRHWADGLAGLTVDQPGEWLGMLSLALGQKLQAAQNWLANGKDLPALAGADIPRLHRILIALADSLPGVNSELTAIARLGLDVRLNGDRLGLSLRLRSNPGAVIDQLAVAASRRANPDDALALKVGADAIHFRQTAPLEDILPGLGQAALAWWGRFLEKAFPERKEAAVLALRAYLDSGPGATVAAGYFQDDAIRSAFWTRTANPAGLLDACGKMQAAMNDLLVAALPGFGPAASTLTAGQTALGAAFQRLEWDSAFLAKYWTLSNEFVAALHNAPPRKSAMPAWLQAPTGLLAAGDGFMAVASGMSAENTLEAALRPGNAPAPLTESATARTTLADLKYRQNFLLLVNYEAMLRFMIASGVASNMAENMRLTDQVDWDATLKKITPKLKKTSSLTGFALGGDDDCLIADVSVPTETLNAVYHYQNLLYRAAFATKDNERQALSSLKLYAVAQVTFQVGRQGRSAVNTGAGAQGYADNFRNLYFGEATGQPNPVNLQLTHLNQANAFAGPSSGLATNASAAKPDDTATPYAGYLFLEPPGLDFSEEFGLVAYPERFGETGSSVFLIESAGELYEMIQEKREDGMPREGEMPALLREKETRRNAPDLWRLARP